MEAHCPLCRKVKGMSAHLGCDILPVKGCGVGLGTRGKQGAIGGTAQPQLPAGQLEGTAATRPLPKAAIIRVKGAVCSLGSELSGKQTCNVELIMGATT